MTDPHQTAATHPQPTPELEPEPGDLPSGWVETTLGEVVGKLVDGSHNPPKAAETGKPMLSARNIQQRRIVFDDFRLISDTHFDEENRRTQIAPNDVLLTIVGAIGRTAVVPEFLEPFTLQRSVAVLKPLATEARLLSYFLESPDLQKFFEANAKGTAQKGIYLKALAETPLPLPPLPEQIRIADKLDTLLARVDAGRERLARVPGLLARLRQSILSAAVSGELTREWRGDAEWEKIELGRVLLEPMRNGRSVRDGSGPEVLRLTALGADQVLWQQSKQGDWEGLDFQKYVIQQGDFLISRGNGSLSLVGRGALASAPPRAIAFPDTMIRR